MIRKSIAVFIQLVCCIFFVACGSSSNLDEYNPRDAVADDYPFAEETMMKVLKCLDEKDSETLKGLFSESVIAEYDVDRQIEDAMEFYEGKSNSHDEVGSGNSSASFKKDHYEYKSIHIYLSNIVTDSGKSYSLECYYVLVDDDNPSNIGITTLEFRNPKELNECYLYLGKYGEYSLVEETEVDIYGNVINK